MLIVCPSCASEYTIDDALLGTVGRRVRCAACREPWFVEALPATLSEPDEDEWAAALAEPQAPAPLAVEASSGRGRKPKRPKAVRSNTGPSWLGRIAGAGRASRTLLLTAASLAVVVGALAGRQAVVRHLPETARLYAALGLPVNLRGGLTIAAVRSETTSEAGGAFLVVEGEIRAGSRGADLPSLALTLRDAQGQALYAWTVDPPRRTVSGGDVAPFRARLAAPPAEAREVLVRFAGAHGNGDVKGAAPARSGM